jgi:hypothetical protein
MLNTMHQTIGTAALAALLVLTGCGSDSGDGSPATTTSASAEEPGPPRGIDDEELRKIRECLSAAGLDDALPSDLPTGRPSDLPSDRPTDLPEDFDPSNPPEGFPSDAPDRGLAALQDPDVQEALQACGIELPQPGDSGGQ